MPPFVVASGFITLTKKSSGKDKKVVFRNNGDFGEELNVFFKVSEDGRDIEICETQGCKYM